MTIPTVRWCFQLHRLSLTIPFLPSLHVCKNPASMFPLQPQALYRAVSPTVSKSLISNCKPIVNMLKQKFGSKNKYKYEILNATQQDSVFEMLTSDIRKTVTALDTILQDPKKFICLNDDLDPRREKDNAVIRAVLLKTYESLFPEPSEFELPLKFWNRVLHVLELEVWRASRNIARAAIYIFLIILIVLTFLYLFNVQFCWFLRRILFNSRHQRRALSSGHYV